MRRTTSRGADGRRAVHAHLSPGFGAELAEELRDHIESGALGPGDQLPTEREIGDQFGVSRAVVREAIGVLRHDGLVESYRGRGSFVATAPLATTFRMPRADLTDTEEVESLIEFLSANEVAATRLAADRRTKADLAAIRRGLDGMAAAVATGHSGVEEDFRFHEAIFHATHNPFFISFASYLEQRVRGLIRAARENTARFARLADKVQEEHRAIFDALSARDAGAAAMAAERHLRNAAERLRLYRTHDASYHGGPHA